MDFRIFLNFYKDEDGEYIKSEFNSLDKVKDYITDNWPNDSYAEDLKTILIKTDRNERMILKYIKKDVFEVYFYRVKERFHYHKKSRIELIFDCLNLFLNQDFKGLETILNKTTRNQDNLQKELIKSHLYSITPNRNWKELRWIVYGIPLSLGCMIGPFIRTENLVDNYVLFFFMIIIFLMGIVFLVPGIIFHFQYYNDNKNVTIKITRGNSKFAVEINGITQIFNKSEIETITQNETDISNKIPWSDYGFTQIKFKSGAILNLTSLLINQLLILDKFHYDDVKKHRVKNNFPFLKQRTTLKTTPNIQE